MIDPIAHGSNELAFRRGRWILVAQGVVFVAFGVWALVRGRVFGLDVPIAQAVIIGVTGLASLGCALRRRAAALLSGVQASLFWLLFVVSAATRASGMWQQVFGYDAADSLLYLAVAILGLVLVLWLFARALGDPDWPSSVMRDDSTGGS
jgi:hypothetical protein